MFFCPPLFLWQTRDDDAKKSPAVLNEKKNKKNWKFMPVSNENHQISWHVSCCFSTCLRSVVVIVLFCFFYENATQYETIFFFVLFFAAGQKRLELRLAMPKTTIISLERERERYMTGENETTVQDRKTFELLKKRNKCKCFSKPLVCVCVCALEFFWWLLQSSALPEYPSS